MKQNIIKINLVALVALSLFISSCEDLEEGSTGAVPIATYYGSESTLNAGLVGIYGTLHRNIWALDNYAHFSGADDMTTQPGLNKIVIREADLFARSGGNQWSTNDYIGNYRAIRACNSYIQNARPDELDEALINSYQADAYFIRGLCYSRLASTFGDVPMPLVDEQDPDFEMSKTPKREVMEQAIQDFETALQWVDNPRDLDPMISNGRVTRTAIRAFLAKTYMQLTGYPYNEADKWEQVKNLTGEIINEGIYTLNDDFAHCFQDPHQVNKEMIFAHIMNREAAPITTQSRVYGNRFANWGDMYMEWTYFLNFPEGYRKEFSTMDSGKFFNDYGNPIVTKYTYATKKPNTTDPVGEVFEHAWQTSNDRAAMRMAEVMLMYAEAIAREGLLPQSIEILNQIKRRAYANGATKQEEVMALDPGFWKIPDTAIDYTSADLPTQQDVIDAIINERAYEFLGEIGGNRWLDLVRLETVAAANANRDSRDIQLIGDPADKEQWWTPIPSTEIKLNPNLN